MKGLHGKVIRFVGALFRSNSDPALIESLFHLPLQGLLPGCELLSCPKDWPRQYVVRLT